MLSFRLTYILFDNDEYNLEWVIALMALYPDLAVTTSLFNENIRPHLEKANPKLSILNPAKIAAPFFVEALNTPAKIRALPVAKPQKTVASKSTSDRLLFILMLTFGGIVLAAATFFHFKENLSWLDAIYFVVVTITTVGYGDINLQHADAISKVVGIVLILCSAVFIWLIFSLLIDRIIKRRTQRLLGRKKYAYKNHIILCGLGRLGYFIAEGLIQKGEKIVIIESNEDSASTRYFRSIHIDVYNGNARHPQVLQDAGAEHCRALISAIGDDSTNLEIGLNARYFQAEIMLVLRIFDESMAEVIREKFDIHLTNSMSFICAEKFASLLNETA
jgi:voltage-gated potassium channel Kch